MIDRLLALQERGRPLINSGRAAASEITQSESLKKEIDALYMHYFGRKITGCKNCYADALIELCTIKKTTAMNKTDLFAVRRGKVLKDARTNDARLNLVRGNETEELALYHLYTNPNSRKFFERLPDEGSLKKLLAEYGKKFEAERNTKNGTGSGIAAADKVINDAKDKATAIEADAVKIREIAEAEAKQIVENANAEAERIKAEAQAAAKAIITNAKEAAKTAKAAAKEGADPILV